MLECASGRRQDGFEIDDRLARLLDYVIGGHFPGLWIESPHSRYINPRPNHRRMRKRARRLRSLGCVNELMCGHDPIAPMLHSRAFASIQSRRALTYKRQERRLISRPSRNGSGVGPRRMWYLAANSGCGSASRLWSRPAPPDAFATAATIGSIRRQITQL